MTFKNILRRSFFAATIVVALCSLGWSQTAAKPESVGMSAERLAILTSTLDQYAKDGQLSGGVALVLRRGKVAYKHSFGNRDREANAPMKDDTIFRIASQSKAITSVAIMMLQEDGKLLISDPVGQYLPEFANTTVAVPKDGGGYDIVKAKRQITIRDLLTHTSGISYGTGVAKDRWEAAGVTGWYLSNRDETIAETVKKIAALPMDAQPGEKFVYGYSTDILGAVIEKVSGQTFDRFLADRIFAPLNMNDTSFYLSPEKANRLAVVYSLKGDGIERAPDPGLGVGQGAYTNGPKKNFSGGAGILSTASDYARFLLMLQNGGTLDGKRILGRKSVELMIVDHIPKISFRPGQGFGLGFAIVKDLGERGVPGSVGEYSWGGAYHSTYWVDPKEELVVVYMTQLIPAGSIDDFGKLRSLIYQSIID
jgi:CubicO group peptidase (beta-lactamase class C family)